MSTHIEVSGIIRSLDQAEECAHAVMHVLSEERACLETRDAEGLTKLMPAKLEALAALEAAERERARQAEALGFPADPEGMRQLLRDLHDEALNARWESLTEQLRALQRTNEANGRLIHRGLEQASEMVAILTGTHPGQAATYGQDGARHGQNGPGRSITSA